MSDSMIYLIVVCIYFAGMLGIGIYFANKVKSTEDMYLAKGKVGPMAIGFSVAATHMSASTYTSGTGMVSVIGYNYAPVALGSSAFPWFSFVLLGDRIRKISARLKSTTLADIIEARYGFAACITAVIIMIVGSFFIIGAQIQAGAISFQMILNIPYVTGLLLFGGLVIFYTMFGGMFAVAYTDLVQGVIMMVSFLILAPIAVGAAGGFGQMNASFAQINADGMGLYGVRPLAWVIGGFVTYGLLQIGGQPGAATRFMIATDDTTLKKSIMWAVLCESSVYCTLVLIGIAGAIIVPNLPSSDMLVFALIQELVHPILGGIIVSACLAAMMSTVDSALLLVSSLVVNNIYVNIMKRDPQAQKTVWVGRLVTLCVGAISILIALDPPDLVTWVVTMGINLMTGSFFAPLVLGLWWPRATKQAGLIGIIGGFLTTLTWYIISLAKFGSLSTFPGGIWPSFVGVAVGLLLVICISKATPAPEKEVIDTFFGDIIVTD